MIKAIVIGITILGIIICVSFFIKFVIDVRPRDDEDNY